MECLPSCLEKDSHTCHICHTSGVFKCVFWLFDFFDCVPPEIFLKGAAELPGSQAVCWQEDWKIWIQTFHFTAYDCKIRRTGLEILRKVGTPMLYPGLTGYNLSIARTGKTVGGFHSILYTWPGLLLHFIQYFPCFFFFFNGVGLLHFIYDFWLKCTWVPGLSRVPTPPPNIQRGSLGSFRWVTFWVVANSSLSLRWVSHFEGFNDEVGRSVPFWDDFFPPVTLEPPGNLSESHPGGLPVVAGEYWRPQVRAFDDAACGFWGFFFLVVGFPLKILDWQR